MKARNKKIHNIKKREQHPFQSGLVDISSVVQKLPVSQDLENLALEIRELSKIQTISVFEIGKRLALAKTEMNDIQDWRKFLEIIDMSNSLASRYIKAYDVLHPFEESLGNLAASKIFELMYVENVEDIVANGLPVEEGRKPLNQVTVREIRSNRSHNRSLKVSKFQSEETKSIVISTRVPTELSDSIHFIANSQGISISEYLSKIIKESVQHNIVEDTNLELN